MIPAQNVLLIRRTGAEHDASPLTPRAPQRSLQSLLLLIPAGFFGLRSLLDSLGLGLDGGGPLRVLLLGLVQGSLCLVDGLLPAFTVLVPGSLFLRLFKLAPRNETQRRNLEKFCNPAA